MTAPAWFNSSIPGGISGNKSLNGGLSPNDVFVQCVNMLVYASSKGEIPEVMDLEREESFKEDTLKKALALFSSREFTALYSSVSAVSGTERVSTAYVFDKGALYVNTPPGNVKTPYITFQLASSDHALVEQFARVLRENVTDPVRPPPAGQVFMLSQTQHGIQLLPIGLGGMPVVSDNYSEDVMSRFTTARTDLESKTPSGRLIMLDGPPGTGKTYLVRGFMHHVPKAKFIIVPPHLVQSLADPTLVTTFIHQAMSDKNRTLVLVLEDADQCLSARKADNMSSISAVLNLSDGIIGGLFDIRILATTNTPIQEWDPAILRPGRLSASIKIGKLSLAQSRKIFARVFGSGGSDRASVVTDEMTLAEIYHLVRKEKGSI